MNLNICYKYIYSFAIFHFFSFNIETFSFARSHIALEDLENIEPGDLNNDYLRLLDVGNENVNITSNFQVINDNHDSEDSKLLDNPKPDKSLEEIINIINTCTVKKKIIKQIYLSLCFRNKHIEDIILSFLSDES